MEWSQVQLQCLSVIVNTAALKIIISLISLLLIMSIDFG